MTTKNKSEIKIQREICEWLEERGVFFWRNNSVGLFDPFMNRYRKKGRFEIIGISDILAVIGGRFVAIEVKSKTGKPTPSQLIFMDKVNKSGGLAFVARSVEEVEKELFLLI
ncbi:MAG TPA: VRR-NUC domain-containing protein [Patescibacteria group bacterium]|nr:VRR-NUC domain-containing protein [Patescibacteria group bacterium]